MSHDGTKDAAALLLSNVFEGHPIEVIERYVKLSPITYAHHCNTPILLLQGEMDYRCQPCESEQFYAILKANECIVEMVRVPIGTHSKSSIGNPIWRKMQNEVILEWFDKYVLGG